MIPKDAFVVGAVGRLTMQKSPDIFFEAAVKIKKEKDNAFFVWVGDGEMRMQIEDAIRKNGLEDCCYITGWQSNVLKYIKRFDVAMLLSRWEGFGLVLAEYMYAGCPIIASRVDAIPDIIHNGVNGLLVPCENADETAKAVIMLKDDRELRDRLVCAAKKDVLEHYSIQRVADETCCMFHELLT